MTLWTLAILVGCGETDQIRRYQVAHEASSATSIPSAESDGASDNAPAEGSPDTGELQYDVPEGWTPGRAGGIRLAAFNVRRDEKSAEVTVVAMGKSAGSLLANVNRWRGQIGLGPVGQTEVEEKVRTLEVDGTPCSYIRLDGPERAGDARSILAVVVPRPNRTLFVKLIGDCELADQEQSNFEAFAKSIRSAASP